MGSRDRTDWEPLSQNILDRYSITTDTAKSSPQTEADGLHGPNFQNTNVYAYLSIWTFDRLYSILPVG